MEEKKQQIKLAVRIEDVIDYYVPLHRGSKSGKTLEGTCPYHRDMRNSLKVILAEQIYECKKCKEKGTVMRFVQDIEGCTQVEAFNILKNWDKLTKERSDRPSKLIQKEVKETVLPSVSIAVLKEHRMVFDSLEFYEPEDDQYASVYKYFRIGRAPEQLPDTFVPLVNRLIFPVYNEVGIIQGFLGIKDETKWDDLICLPHDLMNNHLFGLYKAIESIKLFGFVYIVWDFKELFTMIAAGFKNVVVCLNGTITSNQICLLSKYTNNVVLLSSGDTAEQVRISKVIVKLSTFAMETCHFLLPDKLGIPDVFIKLEKEMFEYYIRQGTRLSRLELIKKHLIDEVDRDMRLYEKTKSVEERLDIKTRQVVNHQKLDKITLLLNYYWEELPEVFE